MPQENGRGGGRGGVGKPHFKTPKQKSSLEQAFSLNQLPSENTQRELAARLDLTQSQIQTWFNHRRQRAKKEKILAMIKAEREAEGGGPSLPKTPAESEPADSEEETEDEEDTTVQIQEEERLQIITHAKGLLKVEIRPDGPPLGFEFDSPPPAPGVVGSTGTNKRKRVMTSGGEMLEDGTFVASKKSRNSVAKKLEAQLEKERRRKAEEAAKEEARREKLRNEQEKRAKREQERALALQAKLEATMRKEEERAERERRKEEERIAKEIAKEEAKRQKEEERIRMAMEREKQKEAMARERERQREEIAKERERRKEAERQEKMKLVEERRREQERRRQDMVAEKERRAEERRKEKELQKALAAQERAALRAKQRELGIGSVEDEELEWEQMMKSRHEAGYGSDTQGNEDNDEELARPPFPPPSITLKLAFASSLKEIGPDVVMIWSFCSSFPELLGLWPASVEEVLGAVMEGSGSRLLGQMHIALIRLALADMEESHAKGATQQALNVVDKAVYTAAHQLEEAWAWGFETDLWRAHLDALTWPEVLRQLAIAVGRGRRRPALEAIPKVKAGMEGEDVVDDSDDYLRLKRPMRFSRGTLKAACWHILARLGPEGIPVADIARKIQEEGLRDLSRCKAPEDIVAATLSKDNLFHETAPGTFALFAVYIFCKYFSQPDDDDQEKMEPVIEVDDDDVDTEQAPLLEDVDMNAAEAAHDEGPDSWVLTLEQSDYNELALAERVEALKMLVRLAIDGPTLRARLEARMDESAKIRKQVQEENKAEKRRKQAEEAARAAKVAREAAKALGQTQAELINEGEGDSTGTGNDCFAEAAKRAMEEAEGRISAEATGPNAQAEEQRRKERYEALRSAEEGTAIRLKPTGLDRRHNKYWRFSRPDGPKSDKCRGRIFIQDVSTGEWLLMADEEGLQIFIESLLQQGVREGQLFKTLKRSETQIKEYMPAKAIALPAAREEDVLIKSQGLWVLSQSTIAASAVRAAGHNLSPPLVSISTPTDDMLLAKLKQDMLEVELALSPEATNDLDRELWRERVEGSTSTAELRLCLGDLETSVSATHVSEEYRFKPFLVKGAWVSCGKEVIRIPAPGETPEYEQEEPVELTEPLQWLPPTVASLSLRLQSLDASLIYYGALGPARDQLAAYRYIQRPTAPVMGMIGAAFHLQGHKYGDCEYINAIFASGPDEKPLLFPELPPTVIEEPYALPIDVLQHAYNDGPVRPAGYRAPRGRGRGGTAGRGGALRKEIEPVQEPRSAKKGSKGKAAARSKARSGRSTSKPGSRLSPALTEDSAPDLGNDEDEGEDADEPEPEAEDDASSEEGTDDEEEVHGAKSSRGYQDDSESPEISDMESD